MIMTWTKLRDVKGVQRVWIVDNFKGRVRILGDGLKAGCERSETHSRDVGLGKWKCGLAAC